MQGLGYTAIKADAKKGFVLGLHYNETNSFLFFNVTKIYQFEAKESEIEPCRLCLSNISKDFTNDNMTKTGSKGVPNVFPFDYSAIDVTLF